MSLALTREFINLVDENGDNKGFVLPCDLFKHLTGRGLDPKKAALMAGAISMAAGMKSNPSLPLYCRTDGPDRELIEIPQNLDPTEIVRQGGKNIFHQVLQVAELLLVPPLTQGLQRRQLTPKARKELEKGIDVRVLKKLKKKKGIFKFIDTIVQNKALLTMLGSVGKFGDLANKLASVAENLLGK